MFTLILFKSECNTFPSYWIKVPPLISALVLSVTCKIESNINTFKTPWQIFVISYVNFWDKKYAVVLPPWQILCHFCGWSWGCSGQQWHQGYLEIKNMCFARCVVFLSYFFFAMLLMPRLSKEIVTLFVITEYYFNLGNWETLD